MGDSICQTQSENHRRSSATGMQATNFRLDMRDSKLKFLLNTQ